jgi:hypothetical protein
MSEPSWQPLIDELARWQQAGLPCRFWWRDDDLITATPRLNSLHALADEFAVEVLVAVIPAQMSASLGRDCAAMPRLVFCQHGYAHQNFAAKGEPDSEFPLDRNLEEVKRELRRGRAALLQQFDGRLLPVFVPPWNHFPEAWLPALAALGLSAISQFYKRDVQHIAGLLRVDTHLDVVDWTTPSGFPAGREYMLIEQLVNELHLRRTEPDPQDAPFGILTHHSAMELGAWQFMHRLLAITHEVPRVEWVSPTKLFQQIITE